MIEVGNRVLFLLEDLRALLKEVVARQQDLSLIIDRDNRPCSTMVSTASTAIWSPPQRSASGILRQRRKPNCWRAWRLRSLVGPAAQHPQRCSWCSRRPLTTATRPARPDHRMIELRGPCIGFAYCLSTYMETTFTFGMYQSPSYG